MSQLIWQKSSFSEPGSDQCVEVAAAPSGARHLRESDAPATVMATSAAALRGLVRSLKGGTVMRMQ
ncbi:DUF397 domain-containing protein [Streptomyces natalensis]|uniref:DUF397 domain-containing protein n=1 Tax=Streptomyces natalensis ATCC 27448 TaxID=1240678 RepID=A0A0D7CEH7_9ACTN|nr:DUF397 domain-containing protein [Streptomyces natalensis]KIZ14285.1 hypothetical protein SNA_34855 [Streptomyces natalensis ATCC 27448]